MSVTNGKLAKNLILSVVAQIISLCVSFLLGFIVPKFVDEYQYAHWQTFLLYFSYAGVLQFGLLDGIILRYAQYDYNELDQSRMSGQFKVLLVWTSIVGLMISGISCLFLDGVYRTVFLLVALGVVTMHYHAYNSYIFQITNRIGLYVGINILQRLVYGVAVILLLIFKINGFVWLCLAELFGEVVAAIFGTPFNKGLFFKRGCSLKETVKETKANVSCGFLLMLANFSASFLIGGARMVIEWHWDAPTFGKVSLSFSAATLFLNFVTALSAVLFPSLKRMDEEELPSLYGKIRGVLSPLLFAALLAYFPFAFLLEKWLPNYESSIVYLGGILPIIVFSTIVGLLTNTYFKAYRKEKQMLAINLATVALGFALALICAYALNSLDLLIYSVVFVIMLRSVVSEIVVYRTIGKKGVWLFVAELALTVVFILSARYFSLWLGMLVYFIALIPYLLIHGRNILERFKKKKNDSVDERTEI
ncbi:MAG: hypothetical protein IJY62_03600 [Clostridia bacterium]|nr:hypothetical protein [Clostridia bacterium]